MNPQDTIHLIQQRLQTAFEMGPLGTLDFQKPKELTKRGRTSCNGNILGKRSGHIWSIPWCFYQIQLPVLPADPHGSINFICFSNNRQCGSGKHTDAVWGVLHEFCMRHPAFTMNDRSEAFVGLYRRYHKARFSAFPVDQAFEDMKLLIEETYNRLNLLKV